MAQGKEKEKKVGRRGAAGSGVQTLVPLEISWKAGGS